MKRRTDPALSSQAGAGAQIIWRLFTHFRPQGAGGDGQPPSRPQSAERNSALPQKIPHQSIELFGFEQERVMAQIGGQFRVASAFARAH
jgi:hypothetical protein